MIELRGCVAFYFTPEEIIENSVNKIVPENNKS